MARTRAKAKGRSDSGSYFQLPHKLLKCEDFTSLSGSALKVLLHLASQFNGKNNGDLSATLTDVRAKGVRSSSTLAAAIVELQQRNLIICTRTGRFMRPGGRCALYGLMWLEIHDCPGKDLEHPPTVVPLRGLSLERAKSPL